MGVMRAMVTLGACAVFVAACSSVDAGAPSSAGNGAAVTTPASTGGIGVSTQSPGTSTTLPTSVTTVAEAGVAETSTPDTVLADTVLADTVTPNSVAAAGDETADPSFDLDTEESNDDDPSFDLGPDVVLDVDVARFPVDDAGVGGAGVGGGGVVPESGDPISDAEPLTGWAGFDRSLESALIRPGNTAASVAVSINGEIVHRAAFGVRDPATGDQAEPQDRFRIASISKPITAITVMQLVEDGVIALNDPIGDLVARHVGLEEARGSSSQLTLRQLLTHRSGFGKYQGTFFGSGADDCADAARSGLVSGAGGGGYVYSNMNYCIAGLAIEAITGLSYERAVYQYLLTPLGLSGMRLAPTFDPGPDEIQHVTTPGRNYMETLGGAGGWIATPSDLVTILDSLDLASGGFKPLGITTVLQMVVPPGGQLGQRGYGLGLINYGGGRFGHTGTIESTHAMLLNRGDGVTWAITVAGQYPGESTALERIMNNAFAAGGFVAG